MVQVFSQASTVLFGLFGLSVLTSKSAFTIFYSLVVIYGLFKFKWNIILQLPLLEKWMIALFPIGVLVSFFSIGGAPTAIEVLTRWTWPLIYFPIVYLHNNKEPREMFFRGLGLGLFIACVYSYLRFAFEYNFEGRIPSFWDLLRWAYFCATAVILLFSMLIRTDLLDKKNLRMIAVLFVMALVSLVLTGSRGAWIGAFFGMFCALIVQRKQLKYYFGYAVLVAILLLSSAGVRDRILSSFSVKKQGGQITSEDGSNAGRLHMWKVALGLFKEVPFFGVGFKNSKPELEKFLAKQTPEYVDKYTKIEYSYNDQHSSYLTLLLQFGGVYFVFIYSFFIVLTYQARKQQMLIPTLLGSYAVYFFYSAIVSFEAVVVFGLLSFMVVNLRKTKV
jgi:O-antigen ligase